MIKISQYIKEKHMRFALSNLKFDLNCLMIVSKGGRDRIAQSSDYNKIYIIEDGKCTLEMDEKEYILKKGTFAIVPKGKINRIYNFSDDFKRITLEFEFRKSNNHIENEMAAISNEKCVYTVSKHMRNCIDYIFEYSNDEYDGYFVAVENMLAAMMFDIFKTINVKMGSSDIYMNQKTEINKKVMQIRKYIYENMASRITVTNISNHFNLSERQLDRIMLNYSNETVKEYINRLKMGKAREYLIVTDDSLSKIASALGFSCEHSFIRFFKRLENITPNEFRKINKKQGM